jgi:hypothetical protein
MEFTNKEQALIDKYGIENMTYDVIDVDVDSLFPKYKPYTRIYYFDENQTLKYFALSRIKKTKRSEITNGCTVQYSDFLRPFEIKGTKKGWSCIVMSIELTNKFL